MAEGLRTGDGQRRATALLATKLFIPPIRPGFVARQRLLEVLDRGSLVPLTLIAAPAGFGKTALLSEWAHLRTGRVAWLSLDSRDNDPGRFWRYMIAALDGVRPGLRADLEQMLTRESAPIETVVDVMINDLAREHGAATLVVDDYHLIQSPHVHDSIQHLVDHAPPDLALIIATRSVPPLKLSRLRAAGDLVELRAADLRFDAAEGRQLLEQAIGVALTDEAGELLAQRTEGWAAGLQLAALSLRERADLDEFVATFSGSNRHVVDYLSAEVLGSQSDDIREFLMRTSVVDRLTADLCNVLSDRSDSQTVLEAIERANLFLVPLDDVRGWWRFHHLFAELLRARLRASDAELERELHRRASSWHEQHGSADEAFEHALAAGETEQAAMLAERHADARLLFNEGATVRRWLDELPDSILTMRPRLLLAQANLALVSGDEEGFGQPFAAAEQAYAHASESATDSFEPSVGRGASLLTNLPASFELGRAHLAELKGDSDATRTHACAARALVSEDEWMLDILVRAHLAVADLLGGKLEEAAAGFATTLALCRDAGEKVVAGRDAELLGLCYRGLGRLSQARAALLDVLEYLSVGGDRRHPIAGRVLVALADAAYQRNDLDAAAAYLAEGIPLCRAMAQSISGSPQPLADALATLAWLRYAQGSTRQAKAAMREAVEAAPRPEVASLLNPVATHSARLSIAAGDVEEADHWFADRRRGADDDVPYSREPEYLTLARLLIAKHDEAAAERLLARLEPGARNRPGSLIEILVLRSRARHATGDREAAISALWHALELAAPDRWTRVFVDEGNTIHELLRAVAGREHPADRPTERDAPTRRHLRTLLEAFEAKPGAGMNVMPEPLSERELEVLRLVAEGLPNAQIASALFVTQDTVKKHITHILGKLGATNRTQAAARARELDLVA